MIGDDYQRALDAAVLFDRPGAGKLVVAGKDAPSFLHNLSTNDINNLPLGAGCEAYFCDSRAKVRFQANIYHVMDQGRHAFRLDVPAGFGESLLKHLDRHLISEAVELADASESRTQFHLAGPTAKATLDAALGEKLPDLAEFQHVDRDAEIRRHDPLGVPGFDIVCDREAADGVRQRLLAAGAVPGTAETFDTLRMENGTPLLGVDITEDRFVMEVARALRAVSYTKGCYLGQEPIVMARDRAGFVNRAFLGMRVLEGDAPPAGTKLLRDGVDVGLVTSATFSPRLGLTLALGYIRRGNQEPGTRLDAAGRAVEVLPFPPVS